MPIDSFTCRRTSEALHITAGCTAIAAAAETALMTPTLDNNLDRVYYSFNTEFGMEAHLTQLHRGPLRTTLARFRLEQHWLQTRLGRVGPHRVPYESRWCQQCALVNQHMVVDSEEHALFDCPLYHDLQQQQPCAQQQLGNLQTFMALSPLQQASFLQACYDRHLGKV